MDIPDIKIRILDLSLKKDNTIKNPPILAKRNDLQK